MYNCGINSSKLSLYHFLLLTTGTFVTINQTPADTIRSCFPAVTHHRRQQPLSLWGVKHGPAVWRTWVMWKAAVSLPHSFTVLSSCLDWQNMRAFPRNLNLSFQRSSKGRLVLLLNISLEMARMKTSDPLTAEQSIFSIFSCQGSESTSEVVGQFSLAFQTNLPLST